MKVFTREFLTRDVEMNMDVELEIIGMLIKEMKACVGNLKGYQINKIVHPHPVCVNKYLMTVRETDDDDQELVHVQKCRICGCDDLHACPGGCWWAAEELCSACFEKLAGTWRGRIRLRRGWPAFYREMKREERAWGKEHGGTMKYFRKVRKWAKKPKTIRRLRDDARRASETMRRLQEEETEKHGWKAVGTKEGLCDHYEMKIAHMNEERSSNDTQG